MRLSALLALGLLQLPAICVAQEPSPSTSSGQLTSPARSNEKLKSTANADRTLTKIEGHRTHNRTNTTFSFTVENIVMAKNGQDFTGRLLFYGNAGLSNQPLTGRFRDDGSLRLNSRFITSQSNHSVRITGTINGNKFEGTEGDYGVVTATLVWSN